MEGSEQGKTAALGHRLQRAEESRDWCLKLLSVLIHEMSQPLTVLAGEIQLALTDPHPEAGYREVLEQCAAQAERMSRLVERLRDLANAERSADIRSRSSILGAVRESVELIRLDADSKRVELRCEGESDLEVAASWEDLKQVALHVLKFAVDRSPDGSAVRILVSASPLAAVCQIIDRGKPLPREEVAHLLDPLTQDPARRFRFADGRLEWCLAKRMTEAWGGSFDVASGPEGSMVSFTAPVWTPNLNSEGHGL